MSPKPKIVIPESEYSITATRASGPGGQHVNKVSTAIQLKFDILNSTLPDEIKQRLLDLKSKRITGQGVLVIKMGAYRSQLRNKEAAIAKLHEIVQNASQKQKKRVPTKASKASIEKRLTEKTIRAEIKSLRKKPE